VIDAGLDIVEIEGVPIAKRGKLSGAKQVWRDSATLLDRVLPLGVEPDTQYVVPLMQPIIAGGHRLERLATPREVRERVLNQLALVAHEVIPQ
jgi:nicotinate phosphoribosyltransferase